jgi:hypothetical protein
MSFIDWIKGFVGKVKQGLETSRAKAIMAIIVDIVRDLIDKNDDGKISVDEVLVLIPVPIQAKVPAIILRNIIGATIPQVVALQKSLEDDKA